MPSRILLITDGPAAWPYAMPLLNEWRRQRQPVRVATTDAALLFWPQVTWSAFSGSPSNSLEALDDERLAWAELVVIAPASGRLIETLGGDWRDRLEALSVPVVIVPALLPTDDEAVAMRQFRELLPSSWDILPPAGEQMALGALGTVLAASPERCLLAAETALTPQNLSGREVLVTAGPTIEDIDPVRYISNRSTGRMGLALATAALKRGATVTVVHGPVALSFPLVPGRMKALPVRSARQMYEATLREIAHCDLAILCAAVADYAPGSCAAHKIKKQRQEALHLDLEHTPDILAAIGNLSPHPFLIGFAAESDDLEANAALKLQTKHCDLVCANNILEPGCGFAVTTNRVTVLGRDGSAEALPLLSKDETAGRILDIAARRL